MSVPSQTEKNGHDWTRLPFHQKRTYLPKTTTVYECQEDTVNLVRSHANPAAAVYRQRPRRDLWGRDCVLSRSRTSSLRKRDGAEFVMYIPAMVDQPGPNWALDSLHF